MRNLLAGQRCWLGFESASGFLPFSFQALRIHRIIEQASLQAECGSLRLLTQQQITFEQGNVSKSLVTILQAIGTITVTGATLPEKLCRVQKELVAKISYWVVFRHRINPTLQNPKAYCLDPR